MKSALFSRLFILSAAILVIATGCTKLKDHKSSTVTNITPEPTVSPTSAGKGGDAVLQILPIHDNIKIDSCMVYVRYNSLVISETGSDYNDSAWVEVVDGDPIARFYDLKPGNYYIFAKGWDIIRSEKVRGGLPYTITKDKDATVQKFNLPLQDY